MIKELSQGKQQSNKTKLRINNSLVKYPEIPSHSLFHPLHDNKCSHHNLPTMLTVLKYISKLYSF